MRKLLLFIIGLISLNATAQFSLKVETQYLELINKNQDKMLHRQNYPNAELVCDTILIHYKKSLSSHFLVELGKSYSITKNWEMAIFSIIRQRALFPNDSLEVKGFEILKDAAQHLNLTKQEINQIIERTKKVHYAGFQAGWHNAITTSFYLKTKKLDAAILHSYALYQYKYPNDKNIVLEEIKWMLQVNTPLRMRAKMIQREAENQKDWLKNMTKKQRMIFLRKQVKYYKKNKAKRQARISLKNYKAEGMNLWQSFYFGWNWMWIWI